MSITVAQAKDIRETLGLTHVVIFGVTEDGQQHVATHGQTEQHAREAAKAGNSLKLTLGWPKHLAECKPLPRVCANCAYYKPDYGTWCFNGWSGDGSHGHCLVEPSASRVGKDHGCHHFQPK